MKGRWTKDFCPFARDQGLLSVIGNIERGQTIFGFSVTLTGASKVLVFKTVTKSKVTEMASIDYHVFPCGSTETTSGPAAPTVVAYVTNKTKLAFTLHGQMGFSYDVIVQGKVKS